MYKSVLAVAVFTASCLTSSTSFAGNDGPGQGQNPPIYQDSEGGPANPWNGPNSNWGTTAQASENGWLPNNSDDTKWGTLVSIIVTQVVEPGDVNNTPATAIYYIYIYSSGDGNGNVYHTWNEIYVDGNLYAVQASDGVTAPTDAKVIDTWYP